MKRGLTLGKFAPFHQGHQYLLETALAEMDEVRVIIYDCPETTPVPLNVRAEWIRRLYPAAWVIEAWDGPTAVGDTPEIRFAQEEYVLGRLKIKGVTHFYSSEFYGRHMSRALGAVDRQVDPARQARPVSGSDVRADPFAHRKWLHPLVYRDLITNIVFLGAPCTGKTTLAARMAEEYKTAWMPEYGREYWEKHQINRRLSLEQLVEIAEGHLEREEALLSRADRHLFTDTNAITTYMFSLAYHKRAHPRLAELAVRARERYDLVFLCEDDIPYQDTWDRSGQADRAVFQKQIASDLLRRKVCFFRLSGSLDVRVERARSIIERCPKYANPGDRLVLGPAPMARRADHGRGR